MILVIDKDLGKPIYVLKPNDIPMLLKGLYLGHICWTIAILFLKCSLLALFWRIFCAVKRARLIIWIMLAETLCWGLAVVSLLNLRHGACQLIVHLACGFIIFLYTYQWLLGPEPRGHL